MLIIDFASNRGLYSKSYTELCIYEEQFKKAIVELQLNPIKAYIGDTLYPMPEWITEQMKISQSLACIILVKTTGYYDTHREEVIAVFPLDKLEEVEAWVTKNNNVINENNRRASILKIFIDNTHYSTVIRGSALPDDELVLYERVVKEKEEREEKERRKLFEELKQIYEGKSKCPN